MTALTNKNGDFDEFGWDLSVDADPFATASDRSVHGRRSPPAATAAPSDGPAMQEGLRRAAEYGDELRRRYLAGENVGWPFPSHRTT